MMFRRGGFFSPSARRHIGAVGPHRLLDSFSFAKKLGAANRSTARRLPAAYQLKGRHPVPLAPSVRGQVSVTLSAFDPTLPPAAQHRSKRSFERSSLWAKKPRKHVLWSVVDLGLERTAHISQPPAALHLDPGVPAFRYTTSGQAVGATQSGTRGTRVARGTSGTGGAWATVGTRVGELGEAGKEGAESYRPDPAARRVRCVPWGASPNATGP